MNNPINAIRVGMKGISKPAISDPLNPEDQADERLNLLIIRVARDYYENSMCMFFRLNALYW
jgi:hypothetical protein